MEQKVTTPAIKGAVLALVLILCSITLYYTGQSENKLLGFIPWIIFAGVIIWSCYYYSEQMNGEVTFSNVFAHGFKTSAAATAIVVVFTFLFIKFIAPEVVDKAINQARINLQEQKTMSDDTIEANLVFTRKFFVPFAVGGAMAIYLFAGLVFSLIGAAVVKKNANPFQSQN